MGRAVIYATPLLVAWLVGQPLARPLDVPSALTLYDRAKYSDFLAALHGSADPTEGSFPIFEKSADRWIGAAAEGAKDRRRIVAAGVALEIAHRLREEPPERAGRYLVWASLAMRHVTTVARETERAWHLAAVAGMEELYFPWVLTADHPSGNLALDQLRQRIGRGGQLAVSLERFPNEPRFLLARAQSIETDSLYRGHVWPTLVPGVVELAKRDAAAPFPADPRSRAEQIAVARVQAAREVLAGVSSVPHIQAAFDALRGFPELQPEIELHVGYLDGVAMQWPSALTHLRRVKDLTGDPYLLYLAEYLIGRILQVTGDPAAASSAFERAHAIMPNARSASTQWAADLVMSERAADADRAYVLLRSAYADTDVPDPWEQFGHGDARLWSAYMVRLRDGLK